MKIDSYKDIITSAKTTVLALFFGGISGLIALALWIHFASPLIVTFIFGAMGTWVVYGLKVPLLLPVIHCVYAFIIIRFRLRGIVLVILLHYLSMFVAIMIVALTNIAPELWEDIRFLYDPCYYGGDPLNIILIPMACVLTIGLSAPHNVFLLSLLFRKVRKVLLLENDITNS